MLRQTFVSLALVFPTLAAMAGPAAAQERKIMLRAMDVYEWPDSTSEVVRTFRSPVEVTVVKCYPKGNWCEITWFEEDSHGYVPRIGSWTSTEAARSESLATRYEGRGWPARMARAVARGDVLVGMTEPMVVESIGRPDEVNASQIGDVRHEQWVYEGPDYRNTYVYLEDGIVTAVQNPRKSEPEMETANPARERAQELMELAEELEGV